MAIKTRADPCTSLGEGYLIKHPSRGKECEGQPSLGGLVFPLLPRFIALHLSMAAILLASCGPVIVYDTRLQPVRDPVLLASVENGWLAIDSTASGVRGVLELWIETHARTLDYVDLYVRTLGRWTTLTSTSRRSDARPKGSISRSGFAGKSPSARHRAARWPIAGAAATRRGGVSWTTSLGATGASR